MEAYIKKHFWVFNLFLTMLVAYSASGLANHLILNQTEKVLQPQNNNKKSRPKYRSNKKRTNWAKTITDRNLFNANPPSPESVIDDPDGGNENNGKSANDFPEPYDPCEDSKISAQLKLTMDAEPEELSYAIIDVNREERIFRVGEEVEQKEIVSIQWNGEGGRVVLRSSNRYECLRLGQKNKKNSYLYLYLTI